MSISAPSRADRLPASARKIRAPFALDPSMTFYSPQENVEALNHPRVAAWLDFIATAWQPTTLPGATRRLALLLPCTRNKPYPTSREHRAVNAALQAAGWRPAATGTVADGLAAVLDAGEDPAVLEVAPLVRDCVVLDRFVVSEPLGLVPYELTSWWDGAQSPATSYDDPGLFESRGTSVSPERADCTAVATGPGRWRWGPAERDAFVTVHEQMVTVLTTALGRLAGEYDEMVAWVSPGLTHLGFLADAARRAVDGLPAARRGVNGLRPLHGVLDVLPGLLELLPTRDQLDEAGERLAERLAAEGREASPGAVRAVFARGDGHDTPLGLPEALRHLVVRLDEVSVA